VVLGKRHHADRGGLRYQRTAPIYDLPSLRELTLVETRIPGVPAEALSQSYSDNCLAAIRAHFRDIEAGGNSSQTSS
jgi:hypothetical protein